MNKKITLLLGLFVFGIPSSAFAARIYFQSTNTNLRVGEPFEVKVLMDAEKQDVNALEGTFIVNKDLFDVRKVLTGSSVITYWINKPSVSSENILFSGIIPGGQTSDKNYLYSLVLYPKKEGELTFDVTDARVLLNDGRGTPVTTRVEPLVLNARVTNTPNLYPYEELEDRDPPDEFTVEIGSNPKIFAGQKYIVFSARDKGTGVDRYEIKESIKKNGEGNWIESVSPQLLFDQKLRSYIHVKAIDLAGNERIVILPPQRNYVSVSLLILSGVLVVLGMVILYSKKVSRNDR